MTYFVAMGPFDGNKGGVGARGWRIWRKGRNVYWEFGGITVERGRFVSYRWAGRPQSRGSPARMYSVADAIVERRNLIEAKKDRGQGHPGYKQLPPGVKILPPLLRKPKRDRN